MPVSNTSSSTATGSGTGRGRGRPRGSGRGRRGAARGTEREASNYYEDELGASPQHTDEVGSTPVLSDSTREDNMASVCNFDLNVDVSESVPVPVGPSASMDPQPPEVFLEEKHEYPGWSVDDMQKMAADPVQFALTHHKVDEEEEDYDNEDG